MGAFEDFLKRQGFVKLDRYGLVLTPDDRVLSTRPAVLDDGLGGKIVGWVDGDLAAAELEHWGAAAKKAAAKPLAVDAGLQSKLSRAPIAPPAPQPAPPAPQPAPVMVVAPRPLPGMTAAFVPQPAPAPVKAAPAPVLAVGSAPVVAAEPIVEEDDWEWTIAMARARAAADETEAAAAAIASSFTAPAPKKTMPMAAIAKPSAKPSYATAEQPLYESWEEARESTAPLAMTPAAATVATVKAAARSTVIPVPTLPVAARPSDVHPLPHTPSARRPSSPRLPAQAAPRSRIARGTGREDTVQTAAVLPANDDLTSPYITLPVEVKPAGFAHPKQVAAKR